MKLSINLSFLPKEPEAAARTIAPFIEALTLANMNYMALQTKPVPSLYKAGVRYEENAPWRDVRAIMKRKTGSCHSLVAWRLAELRSTGEQAKVHIRFVKVNGVEWFHVQVKRLFPKPHVEDPSRLLGMVI